MEIRVIPSDEIKNTHKYLSIGVFHWTKTTFTNDFLTKNKRKCT